MNALDEKAISILEIMRSRGEKLAAAESCTGGGLLKILSDVPGSSDVIWGGIVAYSNEAKISLLNVSSKLLEREGAVSAAVVEAMAIGMKSRSAADWTIAVTGIAGPGGGTQEKPVGTVWICWNSPDDRTESRLYHFDGSREFVRLQTIEEAYHGLDFRLGSYKAH